MKKFYIIIVLIFTLILNVGMLFLFYKGKEANTYILQNNFGGISLTLELSNPTEIGVNFSGDVSVSDTHVADEFGICYSKSPDISASTSSKLQIVDIHGEEYSVSTTDLEPGSTYYYTSYIKHGTLYKYAEIKSFTTKSIYAPFLDNLSENGLSAIVAGSVHIPIQTSYDIEYGILYGRDSTFMHDITYICETDIDNENRFSATLSPLIPETEYYYRSYIMMNGVCCYGDVKKFVTSHPYDVLSNLNFSSATNLSSSGSSNSYIVSKEGLYKFAAVKGNTSESVGKIASASIFWETFGTSDQPNLCELIKAVSYKDGYIAFQTSDHFKKGNAVIAAKDSNGTILWSWHIWFTDPPKRQVYYNNAGTLMDRNLGATSTKPGNIGTLGLLYQWGRKDPFLGSSSTSSISEAKSTITWPDPVASTKSTGSLEYTIAHPTTFVYNDEDPVNYYYGIWTESQCKKSPYDPCPVGWRVPDGGRNGIWAKAKGSYLDFTHNYNSTQRGMNFSGRFGEESAIWYPAVCPRKDNSGTLDSMFVHIICGYYWSASIHNATNDPYYLYFEDIGVVSSTIMAGFKNGFSVRCVQESK